jgi:KUP system potassium uptake protein
MTEILDRTSTHSHSSSSSDEQRTGEQKRKEIESSGDVPLSVAVDRVNKLYVHDNLKTGWKATLLMAIRSLGVIYGDIGTSPLYVIPSIFQVQNITVDEDSVLGAASLIVWSLIMVVTIKYVLLILRMDNHGEGGIFALLFLIPPINPGLRNVFVIATLFGSSFVIGDGCITPAISVISAIEGIETKAPGLYQYVYLISAVIILALFLVQRFGTSKIGISFGPIMVLWFFSIAIFGIIEIAHKPLILAALSPHYGLRFLFTGQGGILVLATVVLCVTGVEAMYADLGHFGRAPIQLSWLCVVLPSLLLNYLGQSAHLLRRPEDLGNLFFLSVPSALFWPELILATLATVIASQAMISGVFSLISQAVSFQYFPNVKISHTSKNQMGQIYIPELNFIMAVITLVIVVIFKHSANLSAAYGVAVSGVMCLTSVMYIAVLHFKNHTHWWKIALYSVTILTIDIAFFCHHSDKNSTWGLAANRNRNSVRIGDVGVEIRT